MLALQIKIIIIFPHFLVYRIHLFELSDLILHNGKWNTAIISAKMAPKRNEMLNCAITCILI